MLRVAARPSRPLRLGQMSGTDTDGPPGGGSGGVGGGHQPGMCHPCHVASFREPYLAFMASCIYAGRQEPGIPGSPFRDTPRLTGYSDSPADNATGSRGAPVAHAPGHSGNRPLGTVAGCSDGSAGSRAASSDTPTENAGGCGDRPVDLEGKYIDTPAEKRDGYSDMDCKETGLARLAQVRGSAPIDISGPRHTSSPRHSHSSSHSYSQDHRQSSGHLSTWSTSCLNASSLSATCYSPRSGTTTGGSSLSVVETDSSSTEPMTTARVMTSRIGARGISASSASASSVSADCMDAKSSSASCIRANSSSARNGANMSPSTRADVPWSGEGSSPRSTGQHHASMISPTKPPPADSLSHSPSPSHSHSSSHISGHSRNHSHIQWPTPSICPSSNHSSTPSASPHPSHSHSRGPSPSAVRGAGEAGSLLPGLPDDVALLCLLRVTRSAHLSCQSVSKLWHKTFKSPSFQFQRRDLGLLQPMLVVRVARKNCKAFQWYALGLPESSSTVARALADGTNSFLPAVQAARAGTPRNTRTVPELGLADPAPPPAPMEAPTEAWNAPTAITASTALADAPWRFPAPTSAQDSGRGRGGSCVQDSRDSSPQSTRQSSERRCPETSEQTCDLIVSQSRVQPGEASKGATRVETSEEEALQAMGLDTEVSEAVAGPSTGFAAASATSRSTSSAPLPAAQELTGLGRGAPRVCPLLPPEAESLPEPPEAPGGFPVMLRSDSLRLSDALGAPKGVPVVQSRDSLRLPDPPFIDQCSGGGHAAVLSQEEIYLLGGMAGRTRANKEVYRLDLANGRWYRVPSMLVARAYFGCWSLANGDIMVAGGHSHDLRELHSVEVYDAWARKWREGPSMPSEVTRFACVEWRGKLLICEGWQWPFHFSPRGFTYDLRSRSWSPMEAGMCEGWTGPSFVWRSHLMAVIECQPGKHIVAHYEPADDSWHTVGGADVPGPLAPPFLVTVHGDTLLVVGRSIRVAVGRLSEAGVREGGTGGNASLGGGVPSLVWDAVLAFEGFEGASANLCTVLEM